MATAVAAVGIGASLLSGSKNRKASRNAQTAQTESAAEAARIQAAASDRAILSQERAEGVAREDLAPFRGFGEGQIGATEDILTPQGQFDFLSNNPLFDAALSNVNQGTNASAASRGRFSAGDTAQELFNNYLGTAFPILQSQTQNLFNAVEIGGNAAARQGNATLGTASNISDLEFSAGRDAGDNVIGAGNAAAAGEINRGNIFGDTARGVAGSLPTLLDGIRNFHQRRQLNSAITNANNAGPFPPITNP